VGTLHSISDIARHQRLKDNDEEYVAAQEMVAELGRTMRLGSGDGCGAEKSQLEMC